MHQMLAKFSSHKVLQTMKGRKNELKI